MGEGIFFALFEGFDEFSKTEKSEWQDRNLNKLRVFGDLFAFEE